MPVSPDAQAFVDYVVDLMRGVGPVTARRMFGGHGLFLEGLMFALVADSVLYLKADSRTLADFEARSLPPFTYHKAGKPFQLAYYQAPEEALEDAECMAQWAAAAYGVALRAAARKP